MRRVFLCQTASSSSSRERGRQRDERQRDTRLKRWQDESTQLDSSTQSSSPPPSKSRPPLPAGWETRSQWALARPPSWARSRGSRCPSRRRGSSVLATRASSLSAAHAARPQETWLRSAPWARAPTTTDDERPRFEFGTLPHSAIPPACLPACLACLQPAGPHSPRTQTWPDTHTHTPDPTRPPVMYDCRDPRLVIVSWYLLSPLPVIVHTCVPVPSTWVRPAHRRPCQIRGRVLYASLPTYITPAAALHHSFYWAGM